MKLDSDLYAYTWKSSTENNCNSYIIGGDVPVIIDPGHQHLVKNLIKQMEKDGNRFEDIRLIIATHGHPDHFEGTQTFARGGVQVAIHQEEEKFLKEIGGQFYRAMGGEMPELKISFYLKEGELKVGSKTFQIIHTPGHSPGSISIYWPEKKALFTGDVVFPMGVGRTDFPGGTECSCGNRSSGSPNWTPNIFCPATGRSSRGGRTFCAIMPISAPTIMIICKLIFFFPQEKP